MTLYGLALVSSYILITYSPMIPRQIKINELKNAIINTRVKNPCDWIPLVKYTHKMYIE